MTSNIHDHINNKVDPSVFPEEKHHILQGNIGRHLSEEYGFIASAPSILGPVGDIIKQDYLFFVPDGKAVNQAGMYENVPKHFSDNSSPLHYGELGAFIDWDIINNPQNNIGYNLNNKSERALNFTHSVVKGTNMPIVNHSLPIKHNETNGNITPSWTQHPYLGTPVGDWTKLSQLHRDSTN